MSNKDKLPKTRPLDNLATDRLARMVEVSRVLNSATTLEELLATILNEVVELTTSESASILLLDHKTRELRFKAASHGMPEKLIDMPVPIESSIAGAVFLTNEPLIIADVSRDKRWHSQIDQEIDFHTESILGVPMHDGADRPVGVIEAINKKQGAFTQVDVETTTVLADLAGVAVEKARLIAALQDANQRLSELDELKSNFISIASHELRTPLSVILGYVSFLRDAADPALADQMDSVLNAAVRLRSLIQDMLNLGYVDTGDMQLELEIRRFDLTELVKEFIHTRDESAQALQHRVTLQIPTTPAPVDADRSMLELMIGNLLDNAFKYTPPGGRIVVSVEHRPSEVWLKIEDSGIGIPETQLERIFDRFHQVQHPLTRRYEGMGLGLAIVKELTDLHQGRLWAESVAEEGSTFYLALPLAEA